MRFRLILGGLLFVFGLIVGLVTIFYPKSETKTIQVQLELDGKAEITVKQPLRGWVSDQATFLLQYVPQEPGDETSVKRYSARFEMAGVDIQPQGTITSNVSTGDTANFKWQIRAAASGSKKGILWLFEKDTQGENVLLYAREFKFIASDYAGVEPLIARAVAVFCLIVGLGLCWSARRLIFRLNVPQRH